MILRNFYALSSEKLEKLVKNTPNVHQSICVVLSGELDWKNCTNTAHGHIAKHGLDSTGNMGGLYVRPLSGTLVL